MNALAALLHPGALLHPMRQYEQAAAQILEALAHDRLWNPSAMISLEDGARQLYLAAESVLAGVHHADGAACRHAVMETAVAGMRLAAERPDPLRTDIEQAYRVAAANAWADLVGEQESHPLTWSSAETAAQDLITRARCAVCAAEHADSLGVEAAASLTAAACIRYLAEVPVSLIATSSRRSRAA
ncbi:Uncharacterised protein [Mycobacteroides abscessus subsp. abscessus]|nr:Uncharacterised protein [Mycobacteroides abscessus subsp. abscessus]SIC94804.1 Uncharacterised protein [Mycobacteroides abscessus subsp. abscessus]SID21533.1 Uncharacterised protein [Mycobacteroides abscessus subsp. abscessus]SID43502.1 Uncharacterised protein [Mycobacteroides abscessus subsp. abscessus]SKV98589.1 Uncharacterised protein [Mycobacteroides abscessus subsp. abscessus]